jgi:Holliday junction resolvase
MTKQYRKYRVDAVQSEIVKKLQSAGYSVLSLSSVGRGCPDLLVGRDGHNYLLEVKSLTGKQNQEQVDFEKGWAGQYQIVTLASLDAFLAEHQKIVQMD